MSTETLSAPPGERHQLAQPRMYNPGARGSSSYLSLSPIESPEHHFRILYIDDDNHRQQKELIFLLPAYTDLVAVPGLYPKPWQLENTILTSVENLSLRNGLPVPF
jgi:hypothetical protein